MPESYHAFPDPVQDQLLGLILALGAEVWVLRDRLSLVEQALSEKGIEIVGLVDEMANRPERVPEMERTRNAFMERFLRTLSREVRESE
jgi:hypothetical protein